MRRLARRLFTFCSAVSLVLLIVVSVVWPLSYWRSLQLWYIDPIGAYVKPLGEPYREGISELYRGHLLWADEVRPNAARGKSKVLLEVTRNPLLRHGGPFGFELTTMSRGSGRSRVVGTPLWPWAVGLAVAPMIWLWRFHRQRRELAGHCRACGYDLRATPGRCPECGTAASPAAPPG